MNDDLAPEPAFDPMAEVIATAMHGPLAYSRSWIERHAFNAAATAIRSYLLSEERVEAASAEIETASGDIYWYCESGRYFDFNALSRATLTAAIGEDDRGR